jgi:cobalamin-dependent methionine synthase I
MFTIIAEKINMTRKRVRKEVWDRNADYIARLAKTQEAAGATHIDVNAGGAPGREVEDMKWLAEVVSESVELPLSFDSSNPDALRAGLSVCNRPGTVVNSITGEKERIANVLPLIKEFDTNAICLTMDDDGMPEDLEGRMRVTDALAGVLTENGIGLDRAHFDHLVRPASVNPGQAGHILGAVRYTKEKYPDAHIALGLSNVSFGVPGRNNLNRAFLAMLVAAGCDGAIMDPTEEGMMSTLLASEAVLGRDEYCMNYLMAWRGGKL